MKKIYRGMQNAAEDINSNFDDLGDSISSQTKFLFSGNVTYNQVADLTGNVKDYRFLIVTCSYSGNRGSLIIGTDTNSFRWSGNNLTNDNTSTWVGFAEMEISKVSDSRYKVTTAKIVRNMTEVQVDGDATDVSLISIVGVK